MRTTENRIHASIRCDEVFANPSGDLLNKLAQPAAAFRAAAQAWTERLSRSAQVVDLARVGISESLNQVKRAQTRHDSRLTSLAQELSSLEEADLLESITGLTSEEVRLRAALQTVARQRPLRFNLIGQ